DSPKDLDDAIMAMIDYDGPYMLDVLVEKLVICFPMIPSGKPHNEMLLGDASTEGAIQAGGAVLV
ncbi:MAG: acetolactate synthase 3 large subunit, partial [Rhodobacteraceae bacterium]|nr:acetolactate synthase 3 large subunit [Paracoccaceae bacterium]